MGRNSAFDHAGNVTIAVVAGAVGYIFSQRAVFLLVPVFALLAGIAVLSIPAEAIDYNRARDLEPEPGAAASHTGVAGYSILFKSQPLVIFGLCVMLKPHSDRVPSTGTETKTSATATPSSRAFEATTRTVRPSWATAFRATENPLSPFDR
jgi:hypothetical protein